MENQSTKYSDFILYSYWRASCAWRVRIALNMKGIEYTIKPIDLLKGEQKSEEYLKINTFGRLPCLEFIETIGETKKLHRLVESTAIIEFLEEAFPDKTPLLPKDPILRAKVKAYCYHIACNIHPMQNLNTLNKVESIGYDKIKWAYEFVRNNLLVLETEISSSMGKYCFGDEVTMADVFLIPQLYFFKRFNKPMDEFPSIVKVQENLSKLEPFVIALPENQIDFK
jgi:maleylacetoacetate isomerase